MSKQISTTIILLFTTILSLFALRLFTLDENVVGSAKTAGTILIWHSWGETEAAALQEVLDKFSELHPDANIIVDHIDPNELRSLFEEAATTGFGPDILIGPNDWVHPLAEARLIQNVDARLDEEVRQRYLPAALETLRYEGGLYGLPASLRTPGLYYNKGLVDKPVATLEELLAQAREGREVGINTSFTQAFWGIRAFGGRLFNEEGKVILDQGGFANWLNWLKSAQNSPGIVLGTNQDSLRALFEQGDLAYLVDGSWNLSQIRESLGQDQVGVVPLPAGPTGSSGPFLGVEALMFSSASSAQQTDLALKTAQFITNAEQQTTLMRKAAQIPANVHVKINARLNPAISAFATQARTAVPLPNTPKMETVQTVGDDAYTQVLEGLQGPVEAALQVTNQINQAYGYEVSEASSFQCDGVGTITLWHTWSGAEAEVLNQIIDKFASDCPNIFVRAQMVPASELSSQLAGNGQGRNGPDLLLVPSLQLPQLVDAGLLKDVGRFTDPQLLQRYTPAALETVRRGETLYALPESLNTQILYYNKALVDVPARTLDDLLAQSMAGNRAAIDINFDDAFWGIPAFGGQLFDDQLRVVLDKSGFADWLTWLDRAEETAGVVLDNDEGHLRQLFLSGEVAYYVGSTRALGELRAELGEELGAVPLPDGPEGSAGPLVTSTGFALNAATSDEQSKLALEFAEYVTNAANQLLLIEQADHVPATANVNVSNRPILAAFLEQIKTAMPYPPVSQMVKVMEFGGDAYALVLEDALAPDEAAQEIARLINQANGLATVSSPGFTCQGAGTLRLWHSWSDTASTEALQALIQAFSAQCPEITVEPVAFEADQLLAHLTGDEATGAAKEAVPEAVTETEAPDLILGSSRWLKRLATAGRIQDVTSRIEPLVVRRSLPAATDTLRLGEGLYGLPIAIDTTVLYYNKQMVPAPAATLDDLLNEAAAGRRVALRSDFYHAFWGVGAFGGKLVMENDQVVLDGDGLTRWLAWLAAARNKTGIMLEADNNRALALFKNGRLAYYIDDAGVLADLQTELGAESVGVARLPAGPEGPATPFLSTEALFFGASENGTTDNGEAGQEALDPQMQIALTFAQFLTSLDGQSLLVQKTGRIPASRGVDTATTPAIAGFVAQAETAMPVPAQLPLQNGWVPGDAIIQQVLDDQIDPAAGAGEIGQRLNEILER